MPNQLERTFAGRTVLVTGHTGFKGGWLCSWLKLLGAKVIGLSLSPEQGRPNLFETARVTDGMTSIIGDIRDPSTTAAALKTHKPDVVFHLAAQPLVRYSYRNPVETFATNIMGTVHVLEAVRHTPSVRAAVMITSDKCYENRETGQAYREDDPMGGRDPYSASKGAAELTIASYRGSFFSTSAETPSPAGIATARAGNVLGGGDWAEDRIIPDCVRSLLEGRPIIVRNPHAIRPWQHVLEPLSGYLWLAVRLLQDSAAHAEAWNFGPVEGASLTVGNLVKDFIVAWGADASLLKTPDTAGERRHEAVTLRLDCSKAATRLKWLPLYDISETLEETAAWYRFYQENPTGDLRGLTERQITQYCERARKMDLAWALGTP